jgi:hypothetical protein
MQRTDEHGWSCEAFAEDWDCIEDYCSTAGRFIHSQANENTTLLTFVDTTRASEGGQSALMSSMGGRRLKHDFSQRSAEGSLASLAPSAAPTTTSGRPLKQQDSGRSRQSFVRSERSCFTNRTGHRRHGRRWGLGRGGGLWCVCSTLAASLALWGLP